MKKIAVFILAVAISFVAAGYRWGDSGHSIGLIRKTGGEARHPTHLGTEYTSHTLIATATVIPPYAGDARVTLEGEPKVDYEIYLSGPVIDLGLKRLPKLEGDVITGLRPLDRLALWVLMEPVLADPVCGMRDVTGEYTYEFMGRRYCFCSEKCMDAFKDSPVDFGDRGVVSSSYELAFTDIKTGDRVLTVPVVFEPKGGAGDAGGHVH